MPKKPYDPGMNPDWEVDMEAVVRENLMRLLGDCSNCHEPACDYEEPHRHGFGCGPLCPDDDA